MLHEEKDFSACQSVSLLSNRPNFSSDGNKTEGKKKEETKQKNLVSVNLHEEFSGLS